MKKLLTIFLTISMLLTLTGCKNSGIVNPVVNPMKEVESFEDFKEIGIDDMKSPDDDLITDIKYYIVNGQIAEIDFVNGDHKYCYRASKELGVAAITGIYSTASTTVSSSIDGISYTLAAYPEGLSAVWIKGMTTYSLFGEGLVEDDNYEFFRIISLITGIEVLEEKVELPIIDENTTKDFIIEWFNDNEFKDVDYIYESSSTVKENYVISLSKSGKVYPSDEIVCKISTGPEKPEIVTLADNLLNSKEEEFLNTLKDLGLGAVKDTTTYYSKTILKGNVFSYDDGNFPVGTIIKYSLSRGSYTFDAEEFNGLTKDAGEELVNKLNKLNAHIELNLEKHETDNHDAGTIYKCTSEQDGIKTKVSCRLAVKPADTRVDLPNYVGTYNNPCGASRTCTVNQINYMIEYTEDDNPAGYISAQTVPAGKVEPGTCVKLIVSSSMAYLYRLETNYYVKFEGSKPSETEEALRSDAGLGKFKNLQFETVSDFTAYPGKVMEISVFDEETNMWNADYTEGNYSKYTKVKCIINDPRVY